MKKRFVRLSGIEKMLFLSVAFTMLLLAVRVAYTYEPMYMFYVWNMFLAVLPLVFSRRLLKQQSINKKSWFLIVCWLLFLPNAPYIITDIFHYELREPVPIWYDLLLVTSAAWNGLLLGIVSLMQVEEFLARHLKEVWVKLSVFGSLLLCGYGVFIGRFLRFNSWDIFTKPQRILYTSASQVIHPFQHLNVWVFSGLFGLMLCIVYYTLQQIMLSGRRAENIAVR